jgi:hypothetical protein
MGSEKDLNNKKEEYDEEEIRKKIREKCSACPKGHVCMIDRDRRVICIAPEKK